MFLEALRQHKGLLFCAGRNFEGSKHCNFYIKTFCMIFCFYCLSFVSSVQPMWWHFDSACKCLHWAFLHHCWSIVNVFRARMCSWYSLEGVYQEILSLGMYFLVHSLGSRECIGSVQGNTALGTVFSDTLPEGKIRNTSSRGKHL